MTYPPQDFYDNHWSNRMIRALANRFNPGRAPEFIIFEECADLSKTEWRRMLLPTDEMRLSNTEAGDMLMWWFAAAVWAVAIATWVCFALGISFPFM